LGICLNSLILGDKNNPKTAADYSNVRWICKIPKKL
jgi:hypothetical protein